MPICHLFFRLDIVSIRTIHQPTLPSKPTFIFGQSRKSKQSLLASLALLIRMWRFLELGGISKTAVTSCVIHCAQVRSIYTRRLFVACERITHLDTVLIELTDILRVPPNQRDDNIYDTVVCALGMETALLCQ